MWMATYICYGGMFAALAATEVTRSIVHRRREKLYGIGGTPDISLIGHAIAGIFGIAGTICGWIAVGPPRR